eukprot:gene20512-biopygen2584
MPAPRPRHCPVTPEGDRGLWNRRHHTLEHSKNPQLELRKTSSVPK